MALYQVSRTDDAGPGEFVSAYVIAGGKAQARGAVAHMNGVSAKGANVVAERVELIREDVSVISTYFDESPTLDEWPTLDEAMEPSANPDSYGA